MSGAAGAIEIRRARPGDEPLFERVADDVFDHPVEPGRLAGFLAEPGHVLVIAIAGGEVVGQIAGFVHRHPDLRPTELYIDEAAVTPRLQRRGIARRMLDEALALGRSLGCEEAWVGTEWENEAARALYASRGAAAEPFAMYVLRL